MGCKFRLIIETSRNGFLLIDKKNLIALSLIEPYGFAPESNIFGKVIPIKTGIIQNSHFISANFWDLILFRHLSLRRMISNQTPDKILIPETT